MYLQCCLRLPTAYYEHAQSVKMGEWQKAPDFSYRKTPIFEIANQTMGIVGMGRIGQSVARVAKAFGMKVLCYSKHPHPELEDEQLHFVSLEELLSNSDIVSLHCPLTEETENMICKKTIALMKPSAILIKYFPRKDYQLAGSGKCADNRKAWLCGYRRTGGRTTGSWFTSD